MPDLPYQVIGVNPAGTVALVTGGPGDAIWLGTVTLRYLQEFVARLTEIARPDDDIDLYQDLVVFLARPAGETRMALVMGRIVEVDPGEPGNRRGVDV